MNPSEYVLLSRRVITPEGMREAGVVVRGGVIADIIRPGDVRADVSVEDCGDCIVMPGLVENHVHLKGPGRTDF